jgi:hypothetical protein
MGNLYGGADSGGDGYGVTFEFSPGSGGWNYNVLYNHGSNGLVFDPAGNLYGNIGFGAYDYGAAGELSPGSGGWTYTQLYSFSPKTYWPENPLIFDQHGNLYGTTYNLGDVFMLSPPAPPDTSSEWNFHLLHHLPSFNGDGVSPYAGLVLDASGNLYGATQGGGIVNQQCPPACGIIFKLAPEGHGEWKETILHRFTTFAGGGSPTGTLALDQYGNIYGTTLGGGGSGNVCAGGCGTVFKMTPSANGKWKYMVLHRFKGTDGAGPQAGVTLDSKGNIYGTTYEGGADYYGVVFEITP